MHMIFTLHLMSRTTSEKENDIVRYGDKGAEKLKYHWFSRLSGRLPSWFRDRKIFQTVKVCQLSTKALLLEHVCDQVRQLGCQHDTARICC